MNNKLKYDYFILHKQDERKKTVPHLTDEEDQLQNIVSSPNLLYL